MADSPEGIERRRGLIELQEAVDRMDASNQILAGAITRVIPDQIRLGLADLRRLFRQIVTALAVTAGVLIIFSLVVVKVLLNRFDHVEENQRIQQCQLSKTEAERTGSLADNAILACKVRR